MSTVETVKGAARKSWRSQTSVTVVEYSAALAVRRGLSNMAPGLFDIQWVDEGIAAIPSDLVVDSPGTSSC